MCGIAAIIEPGAVTEAAQATHDRERQLVGMLDKIRHRGDPDCFGELWAGTGAAIGANRLAIVDRPNARQPQANGEGSARVVFNGELYNYLELRSDLERLGRGFRTTSDTEVLVHAYLEWGPAFVDRLDGMFAFVLFDQRQRAVLAARDHIGIKPLYYAVQAGVHYFASEQKSLFGLAAEIHDLAPGTYLWQGTAVRYFDIDRMPPPPRSQDEAVATFRDLFESAVRKQVQTDLPVAVMFSGGIDSAAVLHVARRHHPSVTAITVGFAGAADIRVARRYCADFGVPHVVAELDGAALIGRIPDVVYGSELFEAVDVADACFGDFAYRQAKQHGFKVMLCGEGSDEVLAGYDLFRTCENPEELMRYRVGNLYRTDLQRVDRSSMLNSIETRVPFMDRPLLEFSYALPMQLKLRDGVEKWILREAFKGDLPPYIAERPKARMPDGSGLKNFLIDYARRPVEIQQELLLALGIDTQEGAFFLHQYLAAGFPAPKQRFRRPGFDYPANSYFEFVS
jgi:asparagine synthase (glutamine-hydrolysing)